MNLMVVKYKEVRLLTMQTLPLLELQVVKPSKNESLPDKTLKSAKHPKLSKTLKALKNKKQIKSRKKFSKQSSSSILKCEIKPKLVLDKEVVAKTNSLEEQSIDTKCWHCGQIFNEEQIEKHMLEQHGIEKCYKCEKCGETFKEKARLEFHKSIDLHISNKESNEFLCSLCGLNLKHSVNYEIHMLVFHRIEKPYTCEICGLKVKRKNSMNAHKRLLHLHTKKYYCKLCGRGYAQKGNMVRHYRDHFDKQKKKEQYKEIPGINISYRCPTCCIFFSSQEQITDHLLTHVEAL